MKILRTDFELTEAIPDSILNIESSRHGSPDEIQSFGNCADQLQKLLENSVGGASSSALIIGAGKCRDIPLTFLTNRFTTLTFLDIAEIPGEWFVENTSSGLETVSLLREDVTGVMAKALDALEVRGFTKCKKLESMSVSLMKLNPICKSSLAPGKYDFVASTLILSQLGRPLQTRMHQCIPKQTMDAILSGSDTVKKDWMRIIDDQYRTFLRKRQIEHIQLLARSVHPGGQVFLSMTPRMTVRETGNGEPVSENELIDEEAISNEIERLFVVESRNHGLSWISPLSVKGAALERRFDVETLALQLK